MVRERERERDTHKHRIVRRFLEEIGRKGEKGPHIELRLKLTEKFNRS